MSIFFIYEIFVDFDKQIFFIIIIYIDILKWIFNSKLCFLNINNFIHYKNHDQNVFIKCDRAGIWGVFM